MQARGVPQKAKPASPRCIRSNPTCSIGSTPVFDYLYRLLERHQKLDRMITAAQRNRFGDGLELLRLKKLKLAIKDRIARIIHRCPARG